MDQRPFCGEISIIEIPTAAFPLRISSAFSGRFDSWLPYITERLVASLFTARMLRLPLINSSMPSLLSPNANAWLDDVPRVDWSKFGPFDQSGSPHLTTTCQLKSSGTEMVSFVLAGTAENAKELRLYVRVEAVEKFADPMTKAVAPSEAPSRRNVRRDIVVFKLRRKSVSFSEFWVKVVIRLKYYWNGSLFDGTNPFEHNSHLIYEDSFAYH